MPRDRNSAARSLSHFGKRAQQQSLTNLRLGLAIRDDNRSSSCSLPASEHGRQRNPSSLPRPSQLFLQSPFLLLTCIPHTTSSSTTILDLRAALTSTDGGMRLGGVVEAGAARGQGLTRVGTRLGDGKRSRCVAVGWGGAEGRRRGARLRGPWRRPAELVVG